MSALSAVRRLAVAGVFIAAGCVGPTPYERATDGYGYSDQEIEPDRYRIVFSGNTYTPRQTVENYLLYRAAEVTLATGHDYFIIADRNTDASTRYYGFVDSYPGFGFGFGPGYYGSGVGFGFGVGTASAYPVTRYEAQANIVVYSGEKPADNVNAYDAHDVIDRLRPTVVFAPEEG